MQINAKGLAMVKAHEGLRLKAYLCPAKVWTIGYGSTLGVKSGMTITEAQAEALLKKDLSRFESAVTRLVKVPLTANQFSALVSFAFNVGEGALERSTLLRHLNAGRYAMAAQEFLKWNKAGGKVLAGLTKRREDERRLFNE